MKVCPRKAGVFSEEESHQAKSQSPVAWIARRGKLDPESLSRPLGTPINHSRCCVYTYPIRMVSAKAQYGTSSPRS